MNLNNERGGRGSSRLEAHLRFYKLTTVVLLAAVVLLSTIMMVGGRTKFARGIKIDGELICLVKDQQSAQRVHQLLIETGKGDLPGEACLEQQWEDLPWPIEDSEVLSVQKAFEALTEHGVIILVDAYTIEINGNQTLPLPAEEFARDVLDAVKARYVVEGERPVEAQTFLEEVKIASIRAQAGNVATEIGTAVERLSQTRSEAKSYTVKAGDSAPKIASDHGMSLAVFHELNPGIKGKVIHPGDKVLVAPALAGLTVKTVTEVSETVEVEPEVEQVHSASIPRGETRVASEGTPGKKLIVKHRTYHNDRMVEEETKETQIVEAPSPKRVLVGAGDRPVVGGGD